MTQPAQFLHRCADVRIIQEILGCSSLDTTTVHVRLVHRHTREDFDKVMPAIAATA